MSYRRLSLVLPVRDQADHIERVLEAYAQSLAKLPIAYELVIVPNGCSDASAQICESVARRLPSARVVNSERGGWGLAVRLGLAATQGDLVAYTNSARTDPDELRRLVNFALVQPNQLVSAVRTRRSGIWRACGSYLFNLECRVLLGLRFRDVNATPKVFPRLFAELFEIARDDDLYDVALHLTCRRHNYPVVGFAISAHSRHGGKSTMRLRSALKLFAGVARLRQPLSAKGAGDAPRN